MDRWLKAARFETVANLEEFDFAYNPATPVAAIRDLATLRFIRPASQ